MRSVYKICKCRDQVKCRHPWWFSYRRPGEPRIRKSLDAVLEKHIEGKTIATQEAERLRIGIIDDTLPQRTRELLGLPLSLAPVLSTLTMAQLLEMYRERYLTRTATGKKQTYQIGAITRTTLPRPSGSAAQLGDWLVTDVTADTVERLREARTVRGVRTRDKGATHVGGKTAANRDLQLLRAAFNWAIDKGYAERTPFKRGGRSTIKLTAELGRSRRLQAGEESRLLSACGVHLRTLVEAALETGCRRGELLSLQWHQLQSASRPEVWLPAGKTKTGKARRVPISTRLQAVLSMRRHDPDGNPFPSHAFVFGNEVGERVGSVKTAWLAACRRAHLSDLHFHDLRREAGSRWMEAGVPLATIQKWLGHANISQTSKYLATTTPGEHEAMRRFEERIGRLTPLDTGGVKPAQPAHVDNKETRHSIHQNTVKH
jgi:integrase